MADRPKVVGLGGSLSSHSSSLAALKIALEAAAERGAETVLFDVRTMDLPMFRRGVDTPSAARRAVRRCVRGARDDLERSP
jgi:FMN reductase